MAPKGAPLEVLPSLAQLRWRTPSQLQNFPFALARQGSRVHYGADDQFAYADLFTKAVT
jgi:hypothetical protein